MGIQGLIPFLEKCSTTVNISDYSGCTVAVDAYCWLHKGVFTCADKLARGEDCLAYVHYCMRYVTMLLSKNIKPILVFDGQHLPAKAETELKRRMLRDQNRKKAAELMRLDRGKEASSLLRRSVDVTHKMALNLIKQCREINVDCIVAPYEADPQLAYLNTSGIAEIVITEDSDLLLFGCKKVLFKMDQNGGGLLIEQERLHLAMNMRPDLFTMEKFRYMCILSGCDYLPSISGVGLNKARQFITRISEPDIYKALNKLGSFVNAKIPPEYRDQFMNADRMFLYQPVYDPLSRKIKPLNEIPESHIEQVLTCKLTKDEAFELAIGNVDPISLKVMDDWNPDTKRTPRKQKLVPARHKSIWSKDFKLSNFEMRLDDSPPVNNTQSTRIVNTASTSVYKFSDTCLKSLEINSPAPTKRISVNENDILDTLEEIYKTEECEDKVLRIKKSPTVRSLRNQETLKTQSEPEEERVLKEEPSVLKKFAKRKLTVIDPEKDVVSGYFSNQTKPSVFDQNCVNPFKCRKTTVAKVDEVMAQSNDHDVSNLAPTIIDVNESDHHKNLAKINETSNETPIVTSSIFDCKTDNLDKTNLDDNDETKFNVLQTNIMPLQSESKEVDENDVDEGFCSQNSNVFVTEKSKPTPKSKKKSCPRLGLSKNSAKGGQTLLSKFGFKTADQLQL
ncbi:exonuclease 1 [Adelges cooleyi]|uniref:exonuclease 1 n=1 Tax=Adelges cooleyi TaxID=133065 RepID=UPI00218081CB|nr:exonuclease 1 [Adelges cooleyi]